MLRINGMQGHVQYLQGLSGTDDLMGKLNLPSAHMLADRYLNESSEIIAIMPPKAMNQDEDPCQQI